jgi:transposase-like protein
MPPVSYARHQFPPVLIQHAVWLYLRFTLSYRDVEDLLAERGVQISYETIRRWVRKFGPVFVKRLRHSHPKPSRHWHLDAMMARIAGATVYLWRAVDHEGEVLDVLVQRRRDKRAALKLMRTLLKKQGFAPAVVTTDKLRSYGAAFGEIGLAARHEQGLRKKQPGRGLASAGPPTRTQDAAVQITGFRSALPVLPRRRPEHVQPPAPPHLPPDAPPLPSGGDGAMAGGDGGVKNRRATEFVYASPIPVTTPSGLFGEVIWGMLV